MPLLSRGDFEVFNAFHLSNLSLVATNLAQKRGNTIQNVTELYLPCQCFSGPECISRGGEYSAGWRREGCSMR